METIMRSSMGDTLLYVLVYVEHAIVEQQKRMITYFNIHSLNIVRLEKIVERDIPIMVSAILCKSSRDTILSQKVKKK